MEFETLRNNVILECQKTEEKLISRSFIIYLITEVLLKYIASVCLSALDSGC